MHINFFRQGCSIHQLRKTQEESRQLDHWFRNGKHFNDPPVPIGLRRLGLLYNPIFGKNNKKLLIDPPYDNLKKVRSLSKMQCLKSAIFFF